MCRGLARWVPNDPAGVMVLCGLCALATVPQQRWVRLTTTILHLCALLLAATLQCTAAWAMTVWGDRWGLCLVALPNLFLCVYILVHAVIHSLPNQNTSYRRSMWNLYCLTVPVLLVPQTCLLIVSG